MILGIYTINGKYSDDSLDEIMDSITENIIERLDKSKGSSKSRIY